MSNVEARSGQSSKRTVGSSAEPKHAKGSDAAKVRPKSKGKRSDEHLEDSAAAGVENWGAEPYVDPTSMNVDTGSDWGGC